MENKNVEKKTLEDLNCTDHDLLVELRGLVLSVIARLEKVEAMPEKIIEHEGRIKSIETKVDETRPILQEIVIPNNGRIKRLEDDIKDIKESAKWASRAMISSIATPVVVAFIMLLLYHLIGK